MSIKGSIVFVFWLVHAVVWSWPGYRLDILITCLLLQAFCWLHILINYTLELITAIHLGPRMLNLLKTLIAILTSISNLLALLMIRLSSNIRRSASLLLLGMHIALCDWRHYISKIDLLSLDSGPLIECCRYSHDLIDIVHLLWCSSNVVLM